jgi:protoporphyrinogen oxidase
MQVILRFFLALFFILPFHIHSETAHYDCVIVGGGISGLASAILLEDYNVLLLEKNDHIGGRTVSGIYKDVHYEKGTEYLGKPDAYLKEILEKIQVKPLEIPSPMDVSFHENEFYWGADGIMLLEMQKSSSKKINKMIKKLLKAYNNIEDLPYFDENSSKYKKLDTITAREWFEKEKFPEIVIDRFNISSRGLFGANIDEVSALSVINEMANDYEGSKLPIKEDALSNTPSSNKSTKAYSFQNGIAEVPIAIAKYLGKKVQVNSTVSKIEKENEKYTISYLNEKGETQVITATTVISSAPAPISLDIASTVLDSTQKSILEEIFYSSYITVSLFSDEAIWDKSFDLAVAPDMYITDIYDSTWVDRHYDKNWNNKNHVATIHVAPKSYEDRSSLALSDEEILEKVYIDLEKVLPGSRKKVRGHDVFRIPYAYPVFLTYTYENVQLLHETTNGSFQLAGDYMIYPTFEAAVISGYEAVKKIKKELYAR